MALDAYLVKVWNDGAKYPTVINPCRTEVEAQTLAARIQHQIDQRGWNKSVTIESNDHIPLG